MRLVNSKQYSPDSLNGNQPEILFGTATPDGDGVLGLVDWKNAPIRSVYTKQVTDNQVEVYTKVKNDGRNDDWLMEGKIAQRVDISEFTDGGSTTGYVDLNASIPIGAYSVRSYLANNTAATGVSTLTAQLGDGTDVDRYSTGTPSVASAATLLALGAPSGTLGHTAAKTPRLTLTEDDDFTDISAWAATVVIEYAGSAI